MPLSAVVRIVNPQGLHARPISQFVEITRRYRARVQVRGPGGEADGGSVLEMMGLAAAQGDELHITALGGEAGAALAALCELVQRGFGER
ncbi:MAG: HPr family phosphocarrier protein [Planctomycetes bacterium]|nr:HPr family phosphocarrier protein [Planctomycetota bacterium]